MGASPRGEGGALPAHNQIGPHMLDIPIIKSTLIRSMRQTGRLCTPQNDVQRCSRAQCVHVNASMPQTSSNFIAARTSKTHGPRAQQAAHLQQFHSPWCKYPSPVQRVPPHHTTRTRTATQQK